MKQAILRKIELWSIKTLYDLSYNKISRINRKHKKIIFKCFGASLFKHFPDSKQQLAITLLRKVCGYEVYQETLLFNVIHRTFQSRPKHTRGEIQDIIRAGKWAKHKIRPTLIHKIGHGTTN